MKPLRWDQTVPGYSFTRRSFWWMYGRALLASKDCQVPGWMMHLAVKLMRSGNGR